MTNHCRKHHLKSCLDSAIQVNRVVFVDRRFGSNKKGKIGYPGYPFRSIAKAIEVLVYKERDPQHQYVVLVSPGHYNEVVNLIPFVNLVGSGVNVTSINGCNLTSSGSVSQLGIQGQVLPLINVVLDSAIEALNKVTFDQIRIQALSIPDTRGLAVLQLGGSGLNNESVISDLDITVTVAASNPITSPQLVFNIGSLVTLNDVNVDFLADFKAPSTIIANSSGKITVNNSSFSLVVSDAPANEVNFLSSSNFSTSILRSTFTSFVVAMLHQPYLADVNYVKVNSSDTVLISDATLRANSVSPPAFNLVNIPDLSSSPNVQLLGLNTLDIQMPKLAGLTTAVKYSVLSGNGTIVSNGSLFTGINTITTTDFPNGYAVTVTDATILSSGVTPIKIFNPTLASLQVTQTGQIITVKNISTTPITFEFQNNTNFDPIPTLSPSAAITYQSNGQQWFITQFPL